MVSAALRLVVGLLLAITLLPWSLALLVAQLRLVHGAPWHPWALAAGLGLGACLVWWRRPNWLIHTVIHETCHALTCALLGVRIRSFQATDGQGGAVIHARVDPIRTTIIALAPYTLPLLLVPALLARMLVPVPSTAAAVLGFVVGLLSVHHLHGLYHNIRINFWGRQGDLTRAGKLLSLVVIVAVHGLLGAWWLGVLW